MACVKKHGLQVVVDKDLSKNSCFTHATTVLSVSLRSLPKRNQVGSAAEEGVSPINLPARLSLSHE